MATVSAIKPADFRSMPTGIVETILTPELAALLLANPHPKQRRSARASVNKYADEMRRGRWNRGYDPILIDDATGQMFNGGHRCSAVIATGISVPTLIDYHADVEAFDYIDSGRGRSAYQFISEPNAATRAASARVILWYRERFEMPLGPQSSRFTTREVVTVTEEFREQLGSMMPVASRVYDTTGISLAVVLAAGVLASEAGLGDQFAEFGDLVAEPFGLVEGHPARVLHTRMMRQVNRLRRRTPHDDWVVLVNAFNYYLANMSVKTLIQGSVPPRVGAKPRHSAKPLPNGDAENVTLAAVN